MFSKGTHVVGTTFSIKSSTKARRESRDTCFFRRLLEIAKGASKVGLGAPALDEYDCANPVDRIRREAGPVHIGDI